MLRRAIYLDPIGRLASPLTSDMFFGAVCWGMRQLGLPTGGLDALLSPRHVPDFAFSGLFPFAKRDGNRVRFYPKPLTLALTRTDAEALARAEAEAARDVADAQDSSAWLRRYKQTLVKWVQIGKSLGGISYLSEALTKRVLAGALDAYALAQEWTVHKLVVQSGAHLLTPTECALLDKRGRPPQLLEHIGTQRNHVDRVRGSTAEGLLFLDQETAFAPGAGLWCLATADEARWPDLDAALRYLADTGFGANRTVGKGQFRISWDAAPQFQAPDNATGLLCLSHYIPANDELDANGTPLAFKIAQVWAKRERKFTYRAPLLKRPMRMLMPGSVIPLRHIKDIYGRLAEAVPAPIVPGQVGWPVYQSGLMLALEGLL